MLLAQVSLHDLRNLKKELHQFDHHNDEVFQVWQSLPRLMVLAETIVCTSVHTNHAYLCDIRDMICQCN